MECLLALAAVAMTLEPAVSPGDDFDAYANSSWLQATEIPAGRSRWNARDEVAALAQRQVAALLAEAPAAERGSVARQVADFRAAERDRAAIERQGLAPVKPLLARIAAVRDRSGLARLLGSGLRADADPMNVGTFESAHWLGLAVGPGNHGEKHNVVFLVQGGLGLGSRERYLDAAAQPQREAYLRHLTRLLELAGFDRASPRAAAALQLETALARSHATAEASADEANAGNRWTREDFARRAPGLDWPRFFDAAGLAAQKAFVVWQPGAVKEGAALVASEPLDVWLDYLRLRTLDEFSAVLPRGFPESAAAFRDGGTADSTSLMDGLVGRLYVERHFPAAQKARVDGIVRNVAAAFRRRVAAAAWMTPGSREIALAKLDVVHFGMGHPERWPNYSTLAVSPTDPVGNRLRLADWNYREALARVGQPVDPAAWWITPQKPVGVLLFNQNAYNFSAALLQPPKYDANASEATNYGAIGAIVGHELSHFVDTLGADYDATGAKVRWWTAADMAGYEAAAAPLVRQYSNYSIPSGEHPDGRLTLVENVADLAGLAAAFDAYRLALGDGARDPEYLHQQDRDFFTGFAHAWRSAYTAEGLRKQVATDHAPERFRIATVRNFDAWYDAFGVRPGQKLYLEPQARVRIW